ncbi:MAG TPA: hypothetical protein VLT84_01715 [Acidobacteriota bacterium]|nr:hypothetical protein [Acidobacteriota bacterium]
MKGSVIKTVFLIAAILAVAVILTPALREWITSMINPKSTCGAATGGAVSATFVPGITVTGDGTVLTAAANIVGLPRKAYPISLTNTTTSPITIDAVRLVESVDNKFIPELELLPECRYMSISGGDCSPSSLPATLAPGGSCTITLIIGRPQTGFLEFRTSLGVLTIPLLAQP